MLKSGTVLVVIVTGVFGCGYDRPEDNLQVVQSELGVIRPGGIVVPAYFGLDNDFTEISGPHSPTLPEIAIVNAGCDYTGQKDETDHCLIAGGPGPSRNNFIHDKIIYLRQRGVKVFGYVYTGGVPLGAPTAYRATGDAYLDMVYWFNNYVDNDNPLTRLNGIFFDTADRASTSGVGSAAYLAHWASIYTNWSGTAVGEQGQSTQGRSIFNWGRTAMEASMMQSYFDCLLLKNSNSTTGGWNYFVLQENYASTFMAPGYYMPTWARNKYDPTHFMTIIHDSNPDGTDVHSIISRARTTWNSAYAYVTDDLQVPNPYDAAPAPAVWNAQASEAGNTSYNFGTAPDILNACGFADSGSTPPFP
jgi:hypothetical protein